MRRYTCEFEIFEDEGTWCAMPLGLDGGTQGDSFEEALENAVEWLQIMAEDAEIWGTGFPKPAFGSETRFGGERVVVSVAASRKAIDTVTAAQAARMLGVSRARVSQLVKSRSLEGWVEGRNAYVTRESVVARLSEPKPVGGRPKKSRLPKLTASL